MFKLDPDATFPCTILIPNGDAPLPLKLTLRRKSRTDLQEFIARAKTVADRALVGEIVDGWQDVDRDFTPAALDDLIERYSGAALAIYTGYLDGHTRAERKN